METTTYTVTDPFLEYLDEVRPGIVAALQIVVGESLPVTAKHGLRYFIEFPGRDQLSPYLDRRAGMNRAGMVLDGPPDQLANPENIAWYRDYQTPTFAIGEEVCSRSGGLYRVTDREGPWATLVPQGP